MHFMLSRDNKTSMNDHINQFTKLLQDLEYNKPPNALGKNKGIINLTFISSLYKDWETFQQAKGESLRTMKTSTLFAEVRAIDGCYKSGSQEATLQPPEAKALSTYFEGNHRSGRGDWNRLSVHQ